MIRLMSMDKTEKVNRWLNGNQFSSVELDENDDEFSTLFYDKGKQVFTSSSACPCRVPAGMNYELQKQGEFLELVSDSSLSSFSEDYDDENVFSTMIEPRGDCTADTLHQQSNERERFLSDIVISKTINGLDVLRVKWDTRESDLLLKVDNVLIPVHRNFLSFNSRYFNLKLKNNDDLIIQIDSTAASNHVTIALEALYNCAWNINDSNVDDIIKICEHWKTKCLLERCKHFRKFSKIDAGCSSKQNEKKIYHAGLSLHHKLMDILRL